MQNIVIQQKIEALEKELKDLKSILKDDTSKKSKNKAIKKNKHLSLYGILKGFTVTEEDFKEAGKSLFPYEK